MKDEATPEQLEIARKIVAGLCGNSAAGREAAELYLRGYCDDALDVKAALAAIIETTELAAKFAETIDPLDGPAIAALLRAGDHLKGDQQ